MKFLTKIFCPKGCKTHTISKDKLIDYIEIQELQERILNYLDAIKTNNDRYEKLNDILSDEK
jgi:hypothetical protein